MINETVILNRPMGPLEFQLVNQSGFKCWPPQLAEQSIFHAVTNDEVGKQIATQWNIRDNGVGYVTRFDVKKTFMDRYQIQKVGGTKHTEW